MGLKIKTLFYSLISACICKLRLEFFILFFTSLSFELYSQTINFAYKTPTFKEYYTGSGYGIAHMNSIYSKKIHTDTLINFQSPVNNPFDVSYWFMNKFCLSSQKISMKFIEDKVDTNLHNFNNLFTLDKSYNYYQFRYGLVNGKSNHTNSQLIKYDKNLKRIWTRKFSITLYIPFLFTTHNFTDFSMFHNILPELADSSFIFLGCGGVYLNPQFKSILYHINSQGTLLHTKKFKRYYESYIPYNQKEEVIDIMTKDNFCYLLYNNYLIKLDHNLQLIRSVQLPLYSNKYCTLGFDRNSQLNAQTIALNYRMYFGQNEVSDYPDSLIVKDSLFLIDTGLTKMIRFRHNYWGDSKYNNLLYSQTSIYGIPFVNTDNYFHIRALQLTNDSTWDIICYNKAQDSSVLGVRHIQFDPKNRKVKKNNFSVIPKLYPKRITNDYGTGTAYLSGRDFFNINFVDQDEFVINQISDSIHWYNKRAIYDVKNFDFSPLPTYPTSCDQGFSLDTIPLTYGYPAGLLTDTTLTLTSVEDSSLIIDSIIPSYNIPTQTYSKELGLLVAKFKPQKDSSCLTALYLKSDTALKAGTSTWYVNYLDFGFVDSFSVRDSIGYMAIRAGRIKITHTHELNNCKDIYVDTVIKDYNKKLYTTRDTFLCPPINYILSVPYYKGVTYKWYHTTDTTHYTTITDTGTYRLTLSSTCMQIDDTIHISSAPIVQFAVDSLKLCSKSLPYKLQSPVIGSSIHYTWNNVIKDSLPYLMISTYGWQRLKIQTACTIQQDSIWISTANITPPTIPDSVSLCATTYKIPFAAANTGMTLEEKLVNSWQKRDSLILTKNQNLVFRWTDSCGAVTYDSIYDYQRGSFPPIPPSATLCETFVSYQVNLYTNIKQYSLVSNTWMLRDSIPLKLGLNYIKREDNCGNIQYDTVTGVEIRIVSNLLPDTVDICTQLFPKKLGVISSYKSYLWSNGTAKDSLNITQEGNYQLTVHDGCMYQYDQVYVREIKSKVENALTEDRLEYCISQKFSKIETSLVYPLYIWNNIPTTKNFIDLDTSYKLVRLAIPRICDTLRDSTKISWLDPPMFTPQIAIDSSYCDSSQGSVKLNIVNISDYKTYRWTWSGDSTSFLFTNSYKGEELILTNLCRTQKFKLPAAFCPIMPIGLPSAFSPNGDGVNDYWGIQGAKSIQVHYLQVFNRWGILVFSTTNPHTLWDGLYRGDPAAAGVYNYILDYEYIPHRVRREQTGTVMVVR